MFTYIFFIFILRNQILVGLEDIIVPNGYTYMYFVIKETHSSYFVWSGSSL